MSERISYTHFENSSQHSFRNLMNKAESTEDVKKFFVQTIMKLLDEVFKSSLELEYEYIKLKPANAPFFEISPELQSQDKFNETWNNSDLKNIIERFATSSMHRFRNLSGNPKRTDTKIRL